MGRFRHAGIALVLILGACSGAKEDLATAREARSLLAERALLAELNLPSPYTAEMQQAAAAQLSEAASTAAQSRDPALHEIAALATDPGRADAQAFRRRAAAVRAIEGRLEAR